MNENEIDFGYISIKVYTPTHTYSHAYTHICIHKCLVKRNKEGKMYSFFNKFFFCLRTTEYKPVWNE